MGHNPRKEEILLNPLSREKIEKEHILSTSLWYFLSEEGPYGPFLESDLQKYFQDSPHFSCFWSLSQFENTEWRFVGEWPQFLQVSLTREPDFRELLPPPFLNNPSFYLMHSGKKTGPFYLNQITDEIDSSDISGDQIFETEDGETWIRLIENIHQDKSVSENRLKVSLPLLPSKKVFEQSNREVYLKIKAKKGKNKKSSPVVTEKLLTDKFTNENNNNLGDKADITLIRVLPDLSEPKESPYFFMVTVSALLGVLVIISVVIPRIPTEEVAQLDEIETEKDKKIKTTHKSLRLPPTRNIYEEKKNKQIELPDHKNEDIGVHDLKIMDEKNNSIEEQNGMMNEHREEVWNHSPENVTIEPYESNEVDENYIENEESIRNYQYEEWLLQQERESEQREDTSRNSE